MSVIPPRTNLQYDQINAPGQSLAGVHPTATGPMPEIGETLRVRNVGTSTLRFAWNSRQYVIPPGGEEFMPFDGVKVYVGDPRATNTIRTMRDSIGIVSFLPDRATEVRRLRLLYSAPFGEYMHGDSPGSIFMAEPGEARPQGNAWDGVRIPHVEIYNIRGERVITVLDDPEGLQSIPVNVTAQQSQNLDRVEQLVSVIEARDRIITALAEKLGIDPNSAALDNPPNVTGEEPPDQETHEDGTPIMQMDLRDDSIKPKKRPRPSEPTTLDGLPEDTI